MTYLQYTEFRDHSKAYFDEVKNGHAFIIVRQGKPIAQLLPFDANVTGGWKRKFEKIRVKNNIDSLSYIMKERNEQ